MIPQYADAAMVSQNKMYCYAASSDSIVSSNGQEDFVSMGANAVIKLHKIEDNLERILSIELLNAAQAMHFRRPLKSSPIIEKFLTGYRERVPFVEDDVVMYRLIDKTIEYLRQVELDF
jgi:histidine ammonia-lyase